MKLSHILAAIAMVFVIIVVLIAPVVRDVETTKEVEVYDVSDPDLRQVIHELEIRVKKAEAETADLYALIDNKIFPMYLLFGDGILLKQNHIKRPCRECHGKD